MDVDVCKVDLTSHAHVLPVSVQSYAPSDDLSNARDMLRLSHRQVLPLLGEIIAPEVGKSKV